ncbi:MAG: PEP-CTERM sorting domain-containing protein [Armatimonadetes bacterium]|nr:PEP-CTERM sorting domain-containing protein [Armatimonadota bacterium]
MKKLLGALLLTSLGAVAFAQIPYSTSFEGPTFNPGLLNGQDSWQTSDSSYGVSSFIARTGSQSVEWSGTDSNFPWAFRSFGNVANAVADVWVFVPGNTHSGFYFGLEAFLDPLAAEFSILTVNKDGEVRGTFGSAGSTDLTVLGNVGSVADSWINIKLSVDTAGSTWGTVNGTHFLLPTLTASTFIEDIDLASYAWSSPSGVTGRAFFDDFSAAPVPEPFTLGAMALGLAAVASKRRKK